MKQLLKDMGICALGVCGLTGLIIGASAMSGRSLADTGTSETEICSQMADNFDETIERMRNDPELMKLIEEHGDEPDGLLDKISAYYGADKAYAEQQKNAYKPEGEIGFQPVDNFDEIIGQMRNDPELMRLIEEHEDDSDILEQIGAYFSAKRTRSE